jgi:hypothetical protein
VLVEIFGLQAGEEVKRVQQLTARATRAGCRVERTNGDARLDEWLTAMIAAKRAGFTLHPDSDSPHTLLWQSIHDGPTAEPVVWADSGELFTGDRAQHVDAVPRRPLLRSPG